MSQLVLHYHDKITTTSLVIAEMFQKEHKNVLRSIEDLECSDEFRALNFELSSYKTLQNKKMPMYYITKDGFMMLAMGFTGEKAAKFRERFIAAFNAMEKALFIAKTPVLIPVYQARILSEASKECPDDRWCVFDEAQNVMLLIEREVGSVNQYDLADGSIGIHWSKFRNGKSWACAVLSYWHRFDDKRGKQMSNSYDMSERKHFKKWLREVYIPTHLGVYLRNKFKGNNFMIGRVDAFLPKMLGRRTA